MPDALTSTFTAVNRQTRGDLPQLDGTNTTRFRPTYLRHAGPTSVKLLQIGWERTVEVDTGPRRRAGPDQCPVSSEARHRSPLTCGAS